MRTLVPHSSHPDFAPRRAPARSRALRAALFAPLVLAVAGAGCYSMRGSSGGGETKAPETREVKPSDVAVPAGYTIEVVATGLTFPSGVTFDASGRPCVVEAGYSYGEVWTTPRLLRVESDGTLTPIASGTTNGPWNGVTFHDGAFYVAEGGEREGGRILRMTEDGRIDAIVEGLPSVGDHHTNGPIAGADGWIYFGQGTATNAGVVGEDNARFGWLPRHPEFHDVPCEDVTLAGENYESGNPLTPEEKDKATTGAFSAFGTATARGDVVPGRVPCNGAILRVRPDGGAPELVAWGFRNPFGLAFSPDGQLYATDNGYDERGSRPVWGTADFLWKVERGRWYGWPDFSGGVPLARAGKPPGEDAPKFLLAAPPNEAPRPVARFAVHSSSDGFDFSRSEAFGHVGKAFVAQFGDMAPGAGKVLTPVGFRVVYVDTFAGVVEDFAVNKAGNGPASRAGGGGLERPVAARFDPDGASLYVVDFGVMTMSNRGPEPKEKTGVLWRITRERRP